MKFWFFLCDVISSHYFIPNSLRTSVPADPQARKTVICKVKLIFGESSKEFIASQHFKLTFSCHTLLEINPIKLHSFCEVISPQDAISISPGKTTF